MLIILKRNYLAITFVYVLLPFLNLPAPCYADDCIRAAFAVAEPLRDPSASLKTDSVASSMMDSATNSRTSSTEESRADSVIVPYSQDHIDPFKTGRVHHETSVLKPYRGWGFLRPVYNLQQEVFRLEKQIAKINVPLNRLEPGTISLARRMSAIEAQTVKLLDQLSTAHNDIDSLQTDISSLKQPIADLRDPVMKLAAPVLQLRNPVMQLRDPIERLREPVLKLYNPLLSVDTHVNSLGKRFSGLDSHFTDLDQRFIELDGRFAELDSRFAELDSRFAELDSRFAALDSRFAKLDARFETLGKELASLQSVLWAVIISVVIAAVIATCIGAVHTVGMRRRSERMIFTDFSPSAKASNAPKPPTDFSPDFH